MRLPWRIGWGMSLGTGPSMLLSMGRCAPVGGASNDSGTTYCGSLVLLEVVRTDAADDAGLVRLLLLDGLPWCSASLCSAGMAHAMLSPRGVGTVDGGVNKDSGTSYLGCERCID
jgi:hypothetical protein